MISLTRVVLVHPVLPWVKIKPATVEEDGNFEIFDIPEAAHPSFDSHDFAVHSFGNGVGDSVGTVAHHVG